MRQVKAYGMEDYERQRAAAAIWRVRMLLFKGVRTGNLSTPVNEALLGAALMSVVIYGGFQVVNGHLTVGELMSFITAFALSYEPLKKLAKLNNSLQMGLGAADRIFDMMDREPSITDRPGAHVLNDRQPEIVFRDAVFSYGGSDESALNGLSFTAAAGKATALVGASGSGKTTAMNLVPRFYDVTGGSVMVGGHDVRDITLESLRRHVALVSQDITIFDDTARANIAYGRPDASDAEIEQAAKAAAADEFIRAMPQGYDTKLGEAGVKLSGGQRQRIAIARAMLRDAPILLLDEATSALDNESERLIQVSLERLQRGRTTLVIAHRLSTVRNADLIVVLDRGRVAEQGRHEELMKLNGVYARMHDMGLDDAA
jgi:subfamily B ATP-binding cassette protein MsbA